MARERYSAFQKIRKVLKTLRLICFLVVAILIMSLLFEFTIELPLNVSKSVDAVFVLGGSIQREILAAQLSKKNPSLKILISQGSAAPCIVKIFEEEGGNLNKVWLENCAESTFENFFFSLPILKKWNVRKIKLITSASHLPRAKWLGRIMLGARGIAIDFEIVTERGVPGNHEFWFKTILDLVRAIIWAIVNQIIEPHCDKIINLTEVDLETWHEQNFSCERIIKL
jgi:uncharacterized SAM-binding protein YcdF (DUF218 family)